MADEPQTVTLSQESERAVMVVFDACRACGSTLATAHHVAALVAEELEKIEGPRVDRAGNGT